MRPIALTLRRLRPGPAKGVPRIRRLALARIDRARRNVQRFRPRRLPPAMVPRIGRRPHPGSRRSLVWPGDEAEPQDPPQEQRIEILRRHLRGEGSSVRRQRPAEPSVPGEEPQRGSRRSVEKEAPAGKRRRRRSTVEELPPAPQRQEGLGREPGQPTDAPAPAEATTGEETPPEDASQPTQQVSDQQSIHRAPTVVPDRTRRRREATTEAGEGKRRPRRPSEPEPARAAEEDPESVQRKLPPPEDREGRRPQMPGAKAAPSAPTVGRKRTRRPAAEPPEPKRPTEEPSVKLQPPLNRPLPSAPEERAPGTTDRRLPLQRQASSGKEQAPEAAPPQRAITPTAEPTRRRRLREKPHRREPKAVAEARQPKPSEAPTIRRQAPTEPPGLEGEKEPQKPPLQEVMKRVGRAETEPPEAREELTAIQRAPKSAAPAPRANGREQGRPSDSAKGSPDVDRMARQVFRLLRRRLRVEVERARGR